MMKKIRLAIFASGSGTNAEHIIRFFSDNRDILFPLIISNKADAYVHIRARQLGVPSFTFNRSAFESGEVLDLLKQYDIDFIVLAGFLLKIPIHLLEAFPDRIINIHPALLPKFGGKGMYGINVHEAVITAGEKESGITIHYVNEHYDEGRIIFQAQCPVKEGDTAEELAERVHALEYEFFPKVIAQLVSQIG